LQQRSHAAADLRIAGRGLRDPGDDLEQRRLAGAVRADHPVDGALLDLERDVAQGPEVLSTRPVGQPSPACAQREVRLRDPVELAEAVGEDREAAHATSAKTRSTRAK